MTMLEIGLIAGGVMAVVLLVVIILQQMKSSKRLEELKEEAKKPRDKEKVKQAPRKKGVAKPAPKPEAKPAPKKPVQKKPATKPSERPKTRPAASAESAEKPPVKRRRRVEQEAPAQKPPVRKAPPSTSEAPVPPAPPVRPKPRPKPAPEPVVDVPVAPVKEYALFSNARAVENLGLSQEEADMFVGELVMQIEGEIPTLNDAINAQDHDKIEKVSHMLKGSATSLGEGGVADVLVDFNTYCKSGAEMSVIKQHMKNLEHHFGLLKKQFPA